MLSLDLSLPPGIINFDLQLACLLKVLNLHLEACGDGDLRLADIHYAIGFENFPLHS
jgi:hypothetical protein